MKKLLSILTIILFIILLTGCGKKYKEEFEDKFEKITWSEIFESVKSLSILDRGSSYDDEYEYWLIFKENLCVDELLLKKAIEGEENTTIEWDSDSSNVEIIEEDNFYKLKVDLLPSRYEFTLNCHIYGKKKKVEVLHEIDFKVLNETEMKVAKLSTSLKPATYPENTLEYSHSYKSNITENNNNAYSSGSSTSAELDLNTLKFDYYERRTSSRLDKDD